MARPLRIEFDGAVYHVTSRGDERKEIFKTVSDRQQFLSYQSNRGQVWKWTKAE